MQPGQKKAAPVLAVTCNHCTITQGGAVWRVAAVFTALEVDANGRRRSSKRQASQLQAARVRHGTLETLRWRCGSFLQHQPLQMTQP